MSTLIKITVAGPVGAGKESILHMIGDYLRTAGLDVDNDLSDTVMALPMKEVVDFHNKQGRKFKLELASNE